MLTMENSTKLKKPIEIWIRRVCIGNRTMVCRSVPHGLNSKMHWAKKREWDMAWKEQVMWLIREQGRVVKPFEYARINVELRSIKPQDKDNAYGSIKPLIDATKGLVIVDDNQRRFYLNLISMKIKHK